ncbi:hypothetical protein C6B37_02075 [Candidatus Phytoplasma phoenicium]|uniref:Solute-binding protein family 5 domain-containing protein n=1 Tax=Candidatus Phytoplasma phoenicium TaxID=198422 RepID=A0A2S8NTK5_9MOLU|nr:hypothetical protein C6B37_02075 [Candidatus Phytoplasma phoenicium]
MNKKEKIKIFFHTNKKIIMICLLIIFFTILTIIIWKKWADRDNNKKNFVVAMTCDITGLDPTEEKNITTSYGNFYFNLVHDKLFVKQDDEIIPQLLKNKPEKNGNLLKCELKDNIFFHNGKKMTSDDVIFTIERGKRNKNNLWDEFESITRIDDKNFQIQLKNDNLWWDFPFEKLRILNKEAVENNETEGIKIGTGAYKLVNYSPNNKIVLELFSQYHEPDIFNNLSKIFKQFQIKISQDDNTNLQELENEDIKVIHTYPLDKIQDLQQDIVKGRYQNIKILEMPKASSNYIYFNKTKTPEKIRKIITQALNIQQIIDDLNLPVRIAKSYINSKIIGYDDNINHHQPNIEEAKKGVSNLNQEEKKLTIGCTKSTPLIQKIIEQLKAVGFEATLQEHDFPLLLESAKKGHNSPYNFIFLGENFDMEYGHSSLEYYFLSNNNKSNFFNIDIEDEPHIEKKLVELKTEKELTNYKEIISKIEKYLLEKHYFFPLEETNGYVLVNKQITQGFEINKFNKFYNINKIKIDNLK